MERSDLSKYQDKLKCAFCRNPMTQSNKVNVNDYDGDFVSVFCDDCQKRYQEHKQLGPKFIVCLCSKEPRELDLDMGKEEIEVAKKQMQDLHLENDKKILQALDENDNYIARRDNDVIVGDNNEVSKMQNKKRRGFSIRP